MLAAIATHDDDLRRRIELLHDPRQHLRGLVSAKLRRYEDHPALDILQHETQVVLAQRRQHRVRDHARQRRCQVDDRGFVPVGQHEGDDASRRKPCRQGLRQGGCLCLQAAGVEAHRAVDDENALRARGCGARQRLGQCLAHPVSLRIGLVRALFVPADRPARHDPTPANHRVRHAESFFRLAIATLRHRHSSAANPKNCTVPRCALLPLRLSGYSVPASVSFHK